MEIETSEELSSCLKYVNVFENSCSLVSSFCAALRPGSAWLKFFTPVITDSHPIFFFSDQRQIDNFIEMLKERFTFTSLERAGVTSTESQGST
jgi:hypothetical protein